MKTIKSLLTSLLCILILISCLPTVSFAASNELTERTKIQSGNTYMIKTADDLKLFTRLVNDNAQTCEGAVIELANDIYFNKNKFTSWTTDENEVYALYGSKEIADNNYPSKFFSIMNFKGTFDGKGHKISGIYCENNGMFADIENAVIKNLTIENSCAVSTKAESNPLGMICSSAHNSTFDNCSVSAIVINKGDYAGGFAGAVSGCSVTGCENKINSEIFSQNYAGGIIGYDTTDADNINRINDCINRGMVGAINNYSGGIIGAINAANVERCANTGIVGAFNDFAGGIAGKAKINGNPLVSCYNTGEIISENFFGGIAGSLELSGGHKESVCMEFAEMYEMLYVMLGYGDGIHTMEWPPAYLEPYFDFDRYQSLMNEVSAGGTQVVDCYSAGSCANTEIDLLPFCGEFTGSVFGFGNCFMMYDGNSASDLSVLDKEGSIYSNFMSFCLSFGDELAYIIDPGIRTVLKDELKTEYFVTQLSETNKYVSDTMSNENSGFPILSVFHKNHIWNEADNGAALTCQCYNCNEVKAETYFNTGDLIEFGSYPQSKVNEGNLLNQLERIEKDWISYNYYSGSSDSSHKDYDSAQPSDYMKYADFSYNGTKYRAVTFSAYRPSATDSMQTAEQSYQDENGYLPDNIYYFRYEPLVWKVLDPEKGIVLCSSVIDSQPYINKIYELGGHSYSDSNHTRQITDYGASYLRSWLNTTFYTTAFSDNEKEMIAKSAITTNDDSEYLSLPTDAVYDKVYVLSKTEAANADYGFQDYNVSDPARMLPASDYAACQGLCVPDVNDGNIYNDFASWHLRSAKTVSWTWHASPYGHFIWLGMDTYRTSVGVVPAFMFKSVSLMPEKLASNSNVKSTDKITLNQKNITISKGETSVLFADIQSDNETSEDLIWLSTDENIASVENGVVTANGAGKADIIVKSEENPEITDYCTVHVASLVAANPNTVIDNDRGLVYGVSANLNSLNDYIETAYDSAAIDVNAEMIGTGTEINILQNNRTVDTYFVVVFGDVDGDGWYDGTDAVIVNCIANGLLTKEKVGEAVYMAADCNHDGVVDSSDVLLLEQAGLLLSKVDQTKPAEELMETSSAYVEYLNLIDQSPTVNEEVETPSEGSTESETKPASFIEKIIAVIRIVIDFIRSFAVKF